MLDWVRYFFKYLNKYMILMWRLGWGKGLNAYPKTLGRYLVIVHKGRKTGKIRRTPLNYAWVEDQLYCVAGFGAVSHWYKNIMATPQVEVWLPQGVFSAEAKDESDSPERLYVMRAVLQGSGFASYAAGINPYEIEDEALAKATADYRVIHLVLDAELGTRLAPNDLAWRHRMAS